MGLTPQQRPQASPAELDEAARKLQKLWKRRKARLAFAMLTRPLASGLGSSTTLGRGLPSSPAGRALSHVGGTVSMSRSQLLPWGTLAL